MKKLILALALLPSIAFAQNGPGLYGGGYPGAKYSGQQDMLADLLFNGGASVTGTGLLVLQTSPTLITPNFTTDFTMGGVLTMLYDANYNYFYNRDAAIVGQVGNTTDPGWYWNNTTHHFRSFNTLVPFVDITATGVKIYGAGDLTTTTGGVKITAATNPAITFGSGASTAATFIANGVATYHFHNSAGEDLFHINQNTGGTQTNYLFASSNITANNPFIQATGSDTNIGFSLITKGTGGFTFNGNAGASTLASLGTAGLTVPTIIGGTTASSTLTLESTSGAGTTDAIIGLTGSQVERFRITTGGLFNIGPAVTPDSQLTVNNNTGATVAPPGSTLLHIIGPDGNNAGQAFDSYGAGTGRFFSRNASGTQASLGAVAANKTLFTISGQGYDTASYGTAATINLVSAETFTASAHGGYMTFLTTPIGTTGAGVEAMRVQGSGGLSVGTTTDPGIGAILANTSIKATTTLTVAGMANVATTSAVCYNTGTGLLTYDGTVGTCTVSDERLKNMGLRIDHALDKLLQINGVSYTWKDPAYGLGPQIGVGAQTVEKVFPELVQTGDNGLKSVDYQRLTAPIIEALRELKADNDNLRACQDSWKCRILGWK